METLIQDIRYGLRVLAKSPGFTAVAILTLALGIGANSTLFSVINSAVLRPLRYANPERLVTVFESFLEQGTTQDLAALENFTDWKRQNQVFDQMEGIMFNVLSEVLTGSNQPERVGIQFVTSGFFQFLGVKAFLGHTFLADDDLEHTVVLSHAFWQRRFAGDSKVLGQTLSLDNQVFTVIGVLPPGFKFFDWFEGIDLWKPIRLNNANWLNRTEHGLFAVARLKPGMTLERAQVEMGTIAGQLEKAYPATNKGWGVKIRPLQWALRFGYGEFLYPLFVAVAFVLLIACANISNLLLARASTRRKEIAIRTAVGAGRSHLIRQLLTESILLALLGGLAGLLLVVWGIELFLALAPKWFPEVTMDTTVFGCTLGMSLLSAIIFGLVPAIQTSKSNLNESLKEGGRSSTAGTRHRTRSTLVVAEIALALVLLTGAGLMINTVLRLQRADRGFNPHNLLTMEMRLPESKYSEPAPKREVEIRRITPQAGILFQQVLERVNALPGVKSAAMIDWIPMIRAEEELTYSFTITGRPVPPPAEKFQAPYNSISSNYFRTMQIPLSKGRGLTERDVQAAPWVVIISEAMARKFFPDQNPVGQWITLEAEGERPREIVGVVGNVRGSGIQLAPIPEMYASHLQQARLTSHKLSQLHKNLVIRASSLSEGLTEAVRKVVAEVDKDQPVYNIKSMEEILSNFTELQRFYMWLLAIFAGLALLLATIGVYGVISYSVSERHHEIGIRMALGAQPREVLQLILKHGLILSLIGVAAGLVASFAATRVLSDLLFGVTPLDPVTFFVVSMVLIGVTLLATYIPARRATKVDPLVALRYE